MKTIEERAKEYTDGLEYNKGLGVYKAYIAGATEQKAVDKANYEQGYHDAVEKARKGVKRVGADELADNFKL